MKSQYEHIIHPFPPLYDNNSKILILGSLPSAEQVLEGYNGSH